MTLVEFLTARLRDDEQAAQATDALEPWTASAEQFGPRVDTGGGHWDREVEHAVWTCDDEEDGCPAINRAQMAEATHIARHDPARVLRDVESKRRIVEEHPIARNTVTTEGDFSNAPGCATCHESDSEVIAFGYCRTLRLLALPYADHPDYREEWRP